MNFILEMIGRSGRSEVRPGGRQLLFHRAACRAGENDLRGALAACERLGDGVMEIMIRAHLKYLLRDAAAAREFARGLEIILQTQRIDALIDAANGCMERGDFTLAGEVLERARAWSDVMLAAAGGVLATGGAAEPLAGAYALSNMLLRSLGRMHLVAGVATCFRARGMREELVLAAATDQAARHMLERELEMLRGRAAIGGAEMHYRLGLIAAALDDEKAAGRAFATVMKMQPHHMGSAARHAAITGGSMELKRAMEFTSEDLAAYFGLAQASCDPAFEQTAAMQSAHARAQIGFVLGQMNLLDETRAAWREMSCV